MKISAPSSFYFRQVALGASLLIAAVTPISCVGAAPQIAETPVALASQKTPRYTDAQLVTEVQKRAFQFFWEKADANTGLVNDRASNRGTDEYTVASIASTGYALASLPVAVEHKWISRDEGTQRALKTLKFLADKAPTEHGWYYHFSDKRTGERVWESEVSSIDTAILLAGGRVCREYFQNADISRVTDQIANRIDWNWMRTNGGASPRKMTLSHGWKPESGFIPSEYSGYSEAMLMYLLGLGADKPLPAKSWGAMVRDVVDYKGTRTISGGPIFMHQMPQNFFPLENRRDDLGFDYWVSSVAATRINRQFAIDKSGERKGYGPNMWGLNAGDEPNGYAAFGAPYGPENGTISPTGALASIPFTPELSVAAIRTMYDRYGDKMWGRYGMGNALNVDKNWFASDVIGIDLGMVLLSIENHQTGLIWDLMSKSPATMKAYKTVGLAITKEAEPRALRIAKNGEVLEDASGTWAVNNSGTGDNEQVIIAFGRGGDFPQYGVISKRNGYLRLNVGGDWGGSVSLVPSFWADGQLYQGTSVTADWVVVDNNLEVTLDGERGGLKSKIKLVMLPPTKGALEARVETQLSGDVKLDARPGEALKLVMLSSMHHSATQWDSSAAYVGDKKVAMPAEGWLVNVQPPVTAKKFGLLGGERDGKVKPTFRVEFDKELPIAGWVTRTDAPQEGNVSLWASSQEIPKTYKYILRVTGSSDVAG